MHDDFLEEETGWNIESEEQELFEHHRFTADGGQEPLRVDKFLVDRLPNASRSRIQTAAEAGCIVVNGKPVKSNYKIRPDDVISLVMAAPPRVFELKGENTPIDIVYEDEDVLVVNKSPGMVVHPGHGNYTGTLVQAVLFHLENLPQAPGKEPYRPGMVHRIDKDTSGLLVFGKNDHAMQHLAKQFFHHTIERKYQALVWGDMKEDSGTIIGSIGRSKQDRKIFRVFPDEEGLGKHAVTHYKVLKRFGYITLVEFQLETGRTHQIRVHSKHIGHTLFNDSHYGGDRPLRGTLFNKYKQFVGNCFAIIPRTALHAKSLGFEHPATGAWMFFESEIPQDFSSAMKKWEDYVQVKGFQFEGDDEA
jgi:23S rRNA pseudouridine1911/1915/1917 synthase